MYNFSIFIGLYLLGVVVEFRVCEADARAVKRDPCAPLHPHHEGAHRENHALKTKQTIHKFCQHFKHHAVKTKQNCQQILPTFQTANIIPSKSLLV
jgi:hypothetical protein